MKLFFITIVVLLMTGLGGCDSLNHRQYLLSQEQTKTQEKEISKELSNLLAPVIEKYNLVNSEKDAKAEGVLLYYKSKSNFPIQFGARTTNKGIVVDLIHFHPGPGETKEYSEIVNDVVEALKQAKSFTFVELDYKSQIK